MFSVRLHLDPPVQAAGEHHPTDLKTEVLRRLQSPWKAAGSRNTIDCRAGWGLKVTPLEEKSMRLVTMVMS